MSLQVEKLEHNMANLTIEMPAEDVETALNNAYKKNKNRFSIPGFRKGKATRAMIEKMYGPEVFYNDAADELIDHGFQKELDENREVEVVSRPEISITQLEKGKPFIFTAKVALKPEVELGKYKGVKIEKIDTTVSDEEVDKEIAAERDRNARTISVENRPVKDGDMTIIDFEGFVDGVAFEGGKGENHPLTIGSHTFIPGFEEQLIGAEIDSEKEINVTFPEDYQAEELKGKDAVFKVTVKEIKEKELPDLDDEFASEVSDYETFAEYKDSVRKNLEERKTENAKREKEEKVIEAIVKDSKMDIPDAMIDEQARRMTSDYAQRLKQQGLTLEQYFMFTNLDMDKFLEQIRPQAVKRIETSLVLEAIVKAEDFKVTDEQYEAELEKMASEYDMELDKLKDLLGEGSREGIESDIKIQKAVDFIVESAKEK
ncbi:MAG: trigger factor [Lachnospiraceae bacterium]|nr:trigger factor [Lachnospiraceae bacterium]